MNATPPANLASTASLDTLETSGFGPDNLSQSFRHSGWMHQRREVYEALKDAEVPQGRQQAFAYCGGSCFLFRSRSDPSEIKVGASCCHDRFCKPCANTRSHVIAANVLPYVRRRQCRFITLTLKHNAESLRWNLDRLYHAFRKLRKEPLWQETQTGGVAFLEVKRSKDKQHWHPHFHVLAQGSFIDVRELSVLWKAITGDSFIIDVRFVRDEAATLRYVTKYASKPFDATLFQYRSVLVEAIQALRGRRMALSFGNWKGLQMVEKPTEDAWENLGSLEEHLYAAAAGSKTSAEYIHRACGEQAERLIRAAHARLLEQQPPPQRPPPYDQLTLLEPPTAYETFINRETD
jgi:replication protein